MSKPSQPTLPRSKARNAKEGKRPAASWDFAWKSKLVQSLTCPTGKLPIVDGATRNITGGQAVDSRGPAAGVCLRFPPRLPIPFPFHTARRKRAAPESHLRWGIVARLWLVAEAPDGLLTEPQRTIPPSSPREKLIYRQENNCFQG